MKIADWISGGELTRLSEDLRQVSNKLEISEIVVFLRDKQSIARGAALREIAHMRTPRCASIGNRMADIAEEALK